MKSSVATSGRARCRRGASARRSCRRQVERDDAAGGGGDEHAVAYGPDVADLLAPAGLRRLRLAGQARAAAAGLAAAAAGPARRRFDDHAAALMRMRPAGNRPLTMTPFGRITWLPSAGAATMARPLSLPRDDVDRGQLGEVDLPPGLAAGGAVDRHQLGAAPAPGRVAGPRHAARRVSALQSANALCSPAVSTWPGAKMDRSPGRRPGHDAVRSGEVAPRQDQRRRPGMTSASSADGRALRLLVEEGVRAGPCRRSAARAGRDRQAEVGEPRSAALPTILRTSVSTLSNESPAAAISVPSGS